MKRYFLNQEDASNKFWHVEADGSQLHIHYGKVGTAGQTQTKALASPEAAATELAKLVREKIRKGYVERAAGDAVPAKPAVELRPLTTLQVLPEKVTGKRFLLSARCKKYRLGKPAQVKQQLESLGATVLLAGSKEPADYYLLGGELTNIGPLNLPVVFEEELCAPPDPTPPTLAWLRPMLYQMLRELLAHPNVRVTLLSLGTPATEDELGRYETELGQPIPAVLKDFYRQLGELKLLWASRNPDKETKAELPPPDWFDPNENGHHEGVIHIMPLHRVLFEDWFKPSYWFALAKNQRIFDFYSNYHMMAVQLDDTPDPECYLGDDYGVTFHRESLRFSDYLSLRLRTYGLACPEDLAGPAPYEEGDQLYQGHFLVAGLPADNHLGVSLDNFEEFFEE